MHYNILRNNTAYITEYTTIYFSIGVPLKAVLP